MKAPASLRQKSTVACCAILKNRLTSAILRRIPAAALLALATTFLFPAQVLAQAPAPVWHDADQQTNSGTGTTATVNRPSNLQEGDLIILIFSQQRSYLDSRTGFSQPEGFHLIRTSHRFAYQIQGTNQAGSTESPETVAYYKIAGPSEPATYTTTVIDHGSTPNWKAVAARVTGHDPVQPIGRRSSIDSGTSSVSSLEVPSLRTTGENSLLVGARTVRRQIEAAPAAPSGMTLKSNQNGTGTADANTNAPALQIASQNLSAFGADTGSRTFSWTGGSARASALMFEIRAFLPPNIPRVNGLYFGSGDNLRYPAVPYAVSTSGSQMFTQYVDGILYVSLVVSRDVNDNVFDTNLSTYMQSGDWTQSPTTAGHRVNSEFAEFTLDVGNESYNWYMGYAGQRIGGNPETRSDRRADIWRADETVSGGPGTPGPPPPGIVMETSFVWNMNNYARRWQTGTNTWVMPGADSNSTDWKSPWLGADNPPVYTFPGTANPNTVVNAAEGYPATGPITFSQTYEYEWPMVYEWAIDLRQFGESPTFVVTGRSHHSPRKDTNLTTDDPFDPPPGGPQPLLDFGDLPGPYPTLLANNGPRHEIDPVGTRLGTSLDSEPDGAPHPQALGDDLSGANDEDGIVFLTPFVPGQPAQVQVTVGNVGGFLSGWVDFNGDGTLTQINVTNVTGPAAVTDGLLADRQFSQPGVYVLTIDVPSNASGVMPSRWRITNNAGQGGNSITGQATSGEVEDHMMATFGDRVWHDLNGNGIQDGGEPGLANVEIRLLDAAGDPVLDGAGNPVTTTTDSNGNYSFIVPPNVQFRAEVVPPPGYVVTVLDADSEGLTGEDNNDFDPSDNRTAPFSLTQGQTATYVDAGLYQPVSIGDYVWEDFNGDGLQNEAATAGLNGVTVNLTGTDGAGNPVNLTTTTANDGNGDPGYYLFSGLAPGTYTVTFVAPDGYVFTSQIGPVSDTNNSDADPVTGAAAPVTLASGDDVIYVDAGLYQPASIGDYVWEDLNGDGLQNEAASAGINGVTVNLTGTDGAGNAVNLSTTTANDGNGDPGYYLFSGLAPGTYTVTFVAPDGYVFTSQIGPITDTDNSDADPGTGAAAPVTLASGDDVTYVDAGLYQPVSIGDFVWIDANGNGIQDSGETGLEGVVVNLLDGSGDPVLDGSGDPITFTTLSDGAYLFEDLPPGTYRVQFILPDGYVFSPQKVGSDDEVDSDPDRTTGITGDIVMTSGQSNLDVDAGAYRQSCPDTWTAWQDKWGDELEGQTGPMDNPDGDRYSNLIEYAFCLPPDSGVGKPFCLFESASVPGGIDGLYRRTAIGGAKDVTYTLEWTDTLGSPTSWTGTVVLDSSNTSVVNNGDGTETVRISDLETLTDPDLNGGIGFVRIRVDLLDEDDNVIATDATDVLGWRETRMELCCRTYNNPFLQCALFTGTVDSVDGQNLVFADSVTENTDLAALLQSGGSYYIEVETGTLAGHRFDVTAAEDGTLTLANDSSLCSLDAPFNTILGAAPADLVGGRVALHRHWTLDTLFPPDQFNAGLDQSESDEVQVFAGGLWRIYWLFDDNGEARWVDAADAGLAEQGASVIPPGQGMFFNNRGAPLDLLAFGEVREHGFVRPLCEGHNLVGGGYPIDQSANQRNYTLTYNAPNTPAGLFGSGDFATADSFFLWRTDADPLANGYDSYFLLNSAGFRRWVKVGDTLANRANEILFLGDRAAFLRVRDDHPDHSVSAPWAPGTPSQP